MLAYDSNQKIPEKNTLLIIILLRNRVLIIIKFTVCIMSSYYILFDDSLSLISTNTRTYGTRGRVKNQC